MGDEVRVKGFLRDVVVKEPVRVLAAGWGFLVVETLANQIKILGKCLYYTGLREILRMDDVSIEASSASWLHVCLVNKDGYAIGWGLNNKGQVLGESEAVSIQNPVRIQLPNARKIVKISAGEEHTLALQEDGALWSWGSNDMGQLGIDDSSIHLSRKPLRVLNDVKGVACGAKHSAAILRDQLFCWGWGIHGQCGQHVTDKVLKPEEVKNLSGMQLIDVCAGVGHTVCLSKLGVYTFGMNYSGQLGQGTHESSSTPVLVDLADPYEDRNSPLAIQCGAYHTIVTAGNTVYGFGSNKHGELIDTEESPECILSPTVISDGDECKLRQAMCGWWSTILVLERET